MEVTMWFMLSVALAGDVQPLEGPGTPEAFIVATMPQRAGLARCFGAGADGQVKLQIEVGATGHVDDVKYSLSTTLDASVVQCLVSQLRKIQLASDAANTRYEWLASAASLQAFDTPTGPKPGQLHVDGSLTVEQVQKVLGRSEHALTYCARKAKNLGETFGEQVDLAFRIGANGQPETVPTPGKTSLDECLNARVAELRFPATTDGSSTFVNWPAPLKP